MGPTDAITLYNFGPFDQSRAGSTSPVIQLPVHSTTPNIRCTRWHSPQLVHAVHDHLSLRLCHPHHSPVRLISASLVQSLRTYPGHWQPISFIIDVVRWDGADS